LAVARLLFVLSLWATQACPAENLDQRVAALAEQLRCLVCQNQTLAESHAPLAVDLRNQIREQLASGASEDEVRQFMVARYGDFVLYRPPFKSTTALLWAGPFLFLAFGAFVLVRFVRRRRVAEPELSPAERAQAAKLLE
jgi:cytochrome c-type biogenesis protein CcmH